MNFQMLRQIVMRPGLVKGLVIAVVLGAVGLLAFLFQDQWRPHLNRLWTASTGSGPAAGAHNTNEGQADEPGDEHAGHNHSGHDEANSLELSAQARRNIGLTTARVELKAFVRRVTMPAIVIGRPGRAEVEVTAPLGGQCMRVYAIEGEAVLQGQPLFDLRLTHEELVKAQSEFLRIAEELDVVAREIKRLQSVQVPGAIAGKTVRQREYEQQKLQAVFNAQRQSLLLHGLTEEQVDGILANRKLLQGVTAFTPEHPANGNAGSPGRPYTVRKLLVKPGQYADAGTPLCQLMDYGDLYIQGRGFEQDADELLQAAREGWEVTATRGENNRRGDAMDGLTIAYVENEVDPVSRSLFFYVRLPNEVVLDRRSADGHRFITWRYKPGQRMKVHVPVERWENRIVLPVDAVAQDGLEYYVFQQNGDHFDRVPVQVEYQDQFSVVIANDGSLFPGDIVATHGAHQLQMALKNKSGGAPDPHAGHNH